MKEALAISWNIINKKIFTPPSNLNSNNSKKIKIENDHSQNITPQQPNIEINTLYEF
jgi:hypothetical protein